MVFYKITGNIIIPSNLNKEVERWSKLEKVMTLAAFFVWYRLDEEWYCRYYPNQLIHKLEKDK